jgi:asparagine synthase (glutamine-hydrolysing)
VLPKVIYHLESFDPALVRSAIPNFFLAELASRHVKVILTGEGADEIYAGYDYLASISSPVSLQKEMVDMTMSLHNTNLQRADRVPMAFGLEARVPFLDVESVALALGLSPDLKMHNKRPTNVLPSICCVRRLLRTCQRKSFTDQNKSFPRAQALRIFLA